MRSLDPILEAKVEGYEMAARQAREGRRIGRPLGTMARVVFMAWTFFFFAAVAVTAAWVLGR